MFEIAISFLIVITMAGLIFTPSDAGIFAFMKKKANYGGENIPEDSVLRRHFLTELQSRAESK